MIYYIENLTNEQMIKELDEINKNDYSIYNLYLYTHRFY